MSKVDKCAAACSCAQLRATTRSSSFIYTVLHSSAQFCACSGLLLCRMCSYVQTVQVNAQNCAELCRWTQMNVQKVLFSLCTLCTLPCTVLRATARSCTLRCTPRCTQLRVHLRSYTQFCTVCTVLHAAARSCAQLRATTRSSSFIYTVLHSLHSSAQFCTVLHSSAQFCAFACIVLHTSLHTPIR